MRISLLFVISGLAPGMMPGRAGLASERSRRLLLPLRVAVATAPWCGIVAAVALRPRLLPAGAEAARIVGLALVGG